MPTSNPTAPPRGGRYGNTTSGRATSVPACFVSPGRGLAALSPSVTLSAVTETPDSIIVRRLDPARTVGWLRAPGPVSVLSITDGGLVCAAGGRGWARLWMPGSTVPAIAAELSDDIVVSSASGTPDGRQLLLTHADGFLCIQGRGGEIASSADLLARPTGSPDYSPGLGEVVVPTEAGVQRISIGADGELHSELIGPDEAELLAVRYTRSGLLALSVDAIYTSAVGEPESGGWVREITIPRNWTLFDLHRPSDTLALGFDDGSVVLLRGGVRSEVWRATLGELRDLRLADDGNTVVTVDHGGTLTRWSPSQRNQAVRRVLRRPCARLGLC